MSHRIRPSLLTNDHIRSAHDDVVERVCETMQGTRLDVTDLHPLRWLPDVANEVKKPTSEHGRCTSHRSCKRKVYCQ